MNQGPAHAREVFAGSLVRVVVEAWDDPPRERDVVRHPGAVAVVALTGDGAVVLVRQLREAVRASLLEIPAGIRDVEGEEPADTGRRELEEETGYRATSMEPLGRIHTSPGFADEAIDLYLARAVPGGDAEAGIDVVTMPLPEAVSAVERGEITDAKTAVGVLLAARRAG